MKYSIAVISGLLLAGLFYSSRDVQAESKEEIALKELQREVYDLTRAIESSKQGQDDRYSQLDQLIRQTGEAVHALSTELTQIQKNVTQSVTEQQARVAEPIAVMRTGLDQVTQDTGAVRTSVDSLSSRMTKVESQLSELVDLVRTLNSAPPTPPPPVTGGIGYSAVDAEALFTGAQRDYAMGTYDLALKGFYDFASQYPDDPRAPDALYYIGLIYDSNQQYDDAVKAFDQILERYGNIPKAGDARFAKANSLMKAGKKAQALKEFQDFLAQYPTHVNAATARARIRELGGKP